MDADEKYLTSAQEAREEDRLASLRECSYCYDHVHPEAGFTVLSGEFICDGCKATALQRGHIALCLDCGDYFYPDFADKNPISCSRCKPTAQATSPG